MIKKITRAVFPVAGLGTRFLPATKASPKEMLPIVDKPIIQYAAEEAIAAGVDELVFVTGRNKRSIEDHFDKVYELEVDLKSKGKHALLASVRDVLPENVSCVYTRQAEALGLGHAILCARSVIGDNPFAVILADDLIRAEPNVLQQMMRVYERHGCSVIGVQTVAPSETGSYGIVSGERLDSGLYKIKAIVEKPAPDKAPSTLAVVGRYILTPRIFAFLQSVQAGAGGEIQLTDGIAALLEHEQVLAYEFTGRRYDCGSKLGYLQATVEYALVHPEVSGAFRTYFNEIARSLDVPGASERKR